MNTNLAPELVSVVMPFYQQDDYLKDAVASVMAQTYREVELVVVDDCSPNCSASEILETIQHSRIRILRNETTLGVAATRNKAIDKAAGSLILPLDADDLMAPTCIESLVGILSDDTGGAFCQTQLFGRDDWLWKPVFKLPELMVLGAPGTVLFRRTVFDAVGGYREDLPSGEDLDFFISALEKGWTFKGLDEPLFYYRRHAGNTTAKIRWLPGDLIQSHAATLQKYGREAAELYEHRRQLEEHELRVLYRRHKKLLFLMQNQPDFSNHAAGSFPEDEVVWQQCLVRLYFRDAD